MKTCMGKERISNNSKYLNWAIQGSTAFEMTRIQVYIILLQICLKIVLETKWNLNMNSVS